MLQAAADTPAAGAPLQQILIASLFASITTAVLLTLIMRHRSGRSDVLSRAGATAGRALGMEPWAALPFLIATLALGSGAFGVFWDISLHIDTGRDPGPLANPAHYFILLALYGVFAAGLVACALHENAERPSPVALRVPGGSGLTVPVGGALLITCGAFALTGFPLDDFWHRMFGQDVTLWGPTHLVMINGAILSVPVLAVLALEARRARRTDEETVGAREHGPRSLSLAEQIVRTLLPAALLFAIAFWATEFDWGVPQYRVVWHPLLLALAGGLALTTGRTVLGRGGAVRVLLVYLLIRGAVEVAVWVLGRSVPSMPLFVVEAACVEALALVVKPEGGGTRALRFGAFAGLICGTVGFAAQYAWTHVWAPVPWTPSLLAEGLPTAVLAGVAGGLLGALLGSGLRRELPAQALRRRVGIGAAAVLVALGANALWVHNPAGLGADVTLTPVAGHTGAADREAYVTVRFSDAALARRAEMRQVLAWQGGKRVSRQLDEVAPGVFRTDGPVPLYGDFKTNLRLQSGRTFVALPLHLPREPSIPTPGVVRPAHFHAAFVSDVQAMQTERKDYVPGWLWTPSAILMLVFCGLFILGISTGLARVADGPDGKPQPREGRRRRAVRAAAPATSGA
jgi:predicted secreted protein